MINRTKLEKLISRADSESINVEERRKRTKELFRYMLDDMSKYLGMVKPSIELKFGSHKDFKATIGWKNVAATAYYSSREKAVVLNERAAVSPYSGLTCSERFVFNYGQALATTLAHEIGHAFDYLYNDYSGAMLERAASFLNGTRITWYIRRRLVESIAEMIAAVYIKSRTISFDYNKLPAQLANDNKNARIYGYAVRAAKGIMALPNSKMRQTLRDLVLSRTPYEKIREIKKLTAY